jgi:hypothetical protein
VSNTFLDRLAVAAEEAQLCNSDARKLEPFRGVHTQEPHGYPLRRNSVPVVLGHIDRHFMLCEYLSDPLTNPVLRIKARHLWPFVSSLFPPKKPLGDAVSFCVDAHTLPHFWHQSLPTRIFGQ